MATDKKERLIEQLERLTNELKNGKNQKMLGMIYKIVYYKVGKV